MAVQASGGEYVLGEVLPRPGEYVQHLLCGEGKGLRE